MNSSINTYAFNHNPVDSAAIGVLGFSLHPFNESGDYIGTVTQNGEYAGTFRLAVTDASKETQADIDLSTFSAGMRTKGDCCDDAPDAGTRTTPTFELGVKGYGLFYASNGPGSYQVSVGKINADGTMTDVFNSSKLNADDLFVVTLLRPGTYRLDNTANGAITHVTVSYPPDPQGRYVQPGPINIDVNDDGFSQTELTVLPTQGMVFTMKTDGNHGLKLTLETPNDGPGDQPVRWQNPDAL